jgi:hypothetical protein
MIVRKRIVKNPPAELKIKWKATIGCNLHEKATFGAAKIAIVADRSPPSMELNGSGQARCACVT